MKFGRKPVEGREADRHEPTAEDWLSEFRPVRPDALTAADPDAAAADQRRGEAAARYSERRSEPDRSATDRARGVRSRGAEADGTPRVGPETAKQPQLSLPPHRPPVRRDSGSRREYVSEARPHHDDRDPSYRPDTSPRAESYRDPRDERYRDPRQESYGDPREERYRDPRQEPYGDPRDERYRDAREEP